MAAYKRGKTRFKASKNKSAIDEPTNTHTPRARRRKMQRWLDKHFPIQKKDDE